MNLREPLQPGERFNAHTIPLHLVDRLLAEYHDVTAFIETGTYLGMTVENVKAQFQRVWTIELGFDLWEQAKAKFAADTHVRTLCGDSGKLLVDVLDSVSNRRALIWLDAHYSGGVTAHGPVDSAIGDELEALKRAPRHDHVLMIDDLDEFTGKNGYPTVPALIQHVRDINPAYTVERLDLRRGVLVAYLAAPKSMR